MNKIFFFFYSSVVTLLPAAALLPVYGSDTALLFLAGDAYLYLGIAESSTADFFSFDGEEPTNGFHPLWQSYVWVLAQLTQTQTALLNLTAWSSILLCLVGVWLLGIATARATGSWLLAGLMTPGVYFLFAGQGINSLSVWNFFSGMEAGLALALTGLTAFIITHFQQDEARLQLWLVLGVVLGFLMLTRLDDIFVGPAIAVCWLIWHPGQFWQRIPATIVLGFPAATMLGLYWYYNLTHVGVLMPVSGAAKGEGALLGNGWVTVATFLAPVIDLRAALTDYVPGHVPISGAAFRVSEIVFPALLGMLFFYLIWRYFRGEVWAPFIAGMCAAMAIKATYNFVAVNYWHQSSWYYSFAFGTISFATALMLKPVLMRLRGSIPALPAILALLVTLVAFMQASKGYLDKHSSTRATMILKFWDMHENIERALAAARPGAKILEFGDGMLNYSFDLPVRHGFVFAGDPKSLDALQQERLLEYSVDTGYNIIASFEYLRWKDASPERSSDEIRVFLENSFLDSRIKAELDKFEYEVIHVYEPLSIPFIALSERE